MQTSTNGRKLIEQFEGLDLRTYNDGTGVLTIGYGHTSAAGSPKVLKGQTITSEQADQILSSDLGKVEAQVNKFVTIPLNQNQFDALVSFQFNTGDLGKSSILKKLNAKDYQGAADAFLLYNQAKGRVLQGLVTRRAAERKLFLTSGGASVMPHAITTSAIAATGAGTASHFPSHWPYILGGTIVVAFIASVIIYLVTKPSQ
jgi:lysozyme